MPLNFALIFPPPPHTFLPTPITFSWHFCPPLYGEKKHQTKWNKKLFKPSQATWGAWHQQPFGERWARFSQMRGSGKALSIVTAGAVALHWRLKPFNRARAGEMNHRDMQSWNLFVLNWNVICPIKANNEINQNLRVCMCVNVWHEWALVIIESSCNHLPQLPFSSIPSKWTK